MARAEPASYPGGDCRGLSTMTDEPAQEASLLELLWLEAASLI